MHHESLNQRPRTDLPSPELPGGSALRCSPSPTSAPPPPSILIVEDEAIIAADLAGRLRRQGYRVAGSAGTGAEAIALAREHRPSMVLMDIRLAGAMDGIQAAEVIRRESHLPVVFLTAHSDVATLHRAKLVEPFGYVLKPFEDRELRTAIEMALHRHHADQEVRRHREWLRVTLTSIGDAVITCDTEERITFVNPVAEALTGWRQDEVRGLPLPRVMTMLNEVTRRPCADPAALVLRDRRAVRLENHTLLLARDGREIPIEDSAAPILEADGRVAGVVLVFHDVTEKRRAQEALAAAHRRTLEILESIGDGFFSVDRQWRVTYVNTRGARLLQQERAAMVGRNLWELFPEAVGSVFQQTYERVLAEGTPARVEAFYAPLGAWMEAHAYPSPEGLSVFYEDVTVRKRAEQELRNAKDDWERTFNSVPDLIALLDEEHRIVRVNRAMSDRLGLSPEACMGRRCFTCVHGTDCAIENCPHVRALREGREHSVEIHETRLGGHFLVTATPRRDEQGRIIGSVHVARDITERKRAEAEREQLMAELDLRVQERTADLNLTVAALRESEGRFRALFERHDAIMLLLDPESGVIVDANPAASRFYGYSRKRLCRLGLADLGGVPQERRGVKPRSWLGVGASLVVLQRTARHQFRTVEVHSSPIVVGGRKLLFAILHDITERRQLERRLVEAGNRERLSIGLDLHDSLGGHLAGTAMLAKALSQQLRERGVPESALANEVMESVNQAVSQTRSLARGLCPFGLQGQGLRSGLEAYAASVASLFRVDCEFEGGAGVDVAEEQVGVHLFRITQEAVNNSIRHGKAGQVRIRLARTTAGLLLQVIDDGEGLPRKGLKSSGMGLHTMRYRAELIGAELEIQRGLSRGTVVSCWLPFGPLFPAAAERVQPARVPKRSPRRVAPS